MNCSDRCALYRDQVLAAIEDSLRGLSTERLKSLHAGDFFTTIYMASSKCSRQTAGAAVALSTD